MSSSVLSLRVAFKLANCLRPIRQELRTGLQRQITPLEAEREDLDFIPREEVEEYIRKGQLQSWVMRDFSNTALQGMNLTDADLAETNLRGANLIETNFTGANLKNADLRETQLFRTNFSFANLTNAIVSLLSEFKLLEECNFSGTDLTGCLFEVSHFLNCNFMGAYEEITSTEYDNKSRFLYAFPFHFSYLNFRSIGAEHSGFWKHLKAKFKSLQLYGNQKFKASEPHFIPLELRLRWDLEDRPIKEIKRLAAKMNIIVKDGFRKDLNNAKTRIVKELVKKELIEREVEPEKEIKKIFWGEFKDWWVSKEAQSVEKKTFPIYPKNHNITDGNWDLLPTNFWYELCENSQITPQDLDYLKRYIQDDSSYEDVARECNTTSGETVDEHLKEVLKSFPEADQYQGKKKERLRKIVWAQYENWVNKQN